jgi:sulfate adenylyltransferase subunit 1 (EFTu-like GTPase family)
MIRPRSPIDFEAQIMWMHDHEMLAGRSYLLKLGTAVVGATFHSRSTRSMSTH